MVRISAEDLGVVINANPVFSGVSLEFSDGALLALTGPSGCGKSTLLNTLGLIMRPSLGDVLVDGVSTKQWKDKRRHKFWKEYASFIYQDYGVIDGESVEFNISLGGQVKSSCYADAKEVLEIVGLGGRDKDFASVLSGGEKQRLGIARALFKDSPIIFADEPTASLDPKNRDFIIELFKLAVSQGKSVVVATHDAYLAEACSQRYLLS